MGTSKQDQAKYNRLLSRLDAARGDAMSTRVHQEEETTPCGDPSRKCRWTILTANRNDAPSLTAFLEELSTVLRQAGRDDACRLFVVDDQSFDDSIQILESWKVHSASLTLHILPLATNLGNQGALAFGLQSLDASQSDYVMTLDCDGEDDLSRIPALMELAENNSDHIVFTERGQRFDPLIIRFFYHAYRVFFMLTTGLSITPSNFMILPSAFVPAVQKSPFLPAFFAMSALRLGFPYRRIKVDRRPRYSGQSSQNIYTLMSHGLVAIATFYERTIPRSILTILGSTLVSLSCFVAAFFLIKLPPLLPFYLSLTSALSLAIISIAYSIVIPFSFLILLMKVFHFAHASKKHTGTKGGDTTLSTQHAPRRLPQNNS